MIRKTLLVGVLAWALGGPALAAPQVTIPAPPDDLSLEEAIAEAMRRSPEVKVAQSELARAEAEAGSQAMWPLRSLSANVSIVRRLDDAGGGLAPGQVPGMVGLGGQTAGAYLTMNIGELVGGAFMMRAAHARMVTAQENLRLVKLQVATGVTEAYAAWVAQKKLMALRQDAIKASQSDVVVLERLFGRGGANINDLLKARLALSQSQVDLLTAEGEYNRAWTTLLQRMGDSAWLDKTTNSGTKAASPAGKSAKSARDGKR